VRSAKAVVLQVIILLPLASLTACVLNPAAPRHPPVPLGYYLSDEEGTRLVTGHAVVVGPQYVLTTRHQFESAYGPLDDASPGRGFARVGASVHGRWMREFRPLYIRNRPPESDHSDLLLLAIGGWAESGKLDAPPIWQDLPAAGTTSNTPLALPPIGREVWVVVSKGCGIEELSGEHASGPTPLIWHRGRVVEVPPIEPNALARALKHHERTEALHIPMPRRSFSVVLDDDLVTKGMSPTVYAGWSGAGVYERTGEDARLIGIIIRGGATIPEGADVNDPLRDLSEDRGVMMAEAPDWFQLTPDGPAYPMPQLMEKP
jgi:hypothetical protein